MGLVMTETGNDLAHIELDVAKQKGLVTLKEDQLKGVTHEFTWDAAGEITLESTYQGKDGRTDSPITDSAGAADGRTAPPGHPLEAAPGAGKKTGIVAGLKLW